MKGGIDPASDPKVTILISPADAVVAGSWCR